MSRPKDNNGVSFYRPWKYRIRVLGMLDESWSGRIGSMKIIVSEAEGQKNLITELVGAVRDQAELSGILETLYEFHLTLVSVEMLEGYNQLISKQN